MPDAAGPVLVTGASGFVGSHLVERLVREGIPVRALLRGGSSERWIAKSPLVELRRASFDDAAGLEAAFDGVTTVFHLAAATSAATREGYFRANLDTTRAVIEATKRAAPGARLIFCSSQAASGPSHDGRPVTETDAMRPISPYGESKRDAEQLVLESGLHTTIIRPPTVYGPRDKDLLEVFWWAKRRLAPLVGSNSQKLSIIHVADLVNGFVAAMQAKSGSIYFFTDGLTHIRSDLLRHVASAVETSPINLRIPAGIAIPGAYISRTAARVIGFRPLLTPERIRDFCQPAWTCDDSLARTELGYTSSVGVAEGMKETAQWYIEHKWI